MIGTLVKILEWDEKKYGTGIELIDSQHKELLKIATKIANCEFQNHDILGELIDDLLKYAEYHFTAEEDYMKSINYPEYEKHVNLHKYYIEKIIKKKNTPDYLKQAEIRELFVFICGWIVAHIAKEDKKLKNDKR